MNNIPIFIVLERLGILKIRGFSKCECDWHFFSPTVVNPLRSKVDRKSVADTEGQKEHNEKVSYTKNNQEI
jgi:hypothetical protein